MPIDIYQIKDLFGNNGSYEVPNSIPTTFEDKKEGLKKRPTINDFGTGTIRLVGGHGNGARYAGRGYFLKKQTPLQQNPDIKKQVWLYTLELCVGCNYVLSNTVHIKGDIAAWNIDEDLAKNLNRCKQSVEKPARIFRIPFKKQTKTRTKIGKLGKFPNKVMSKASGELLKGNFDALRGFTNANKTTLYKNRKDIYIFGFLESDTLQKGWKQKVADIINEELERINTDNKRRVGNVTTPNQNNALLNHVCLTYNEKSIGSLDGAKRILKIDLSEAKDIVEINWNDLKETEPYTPVNIDTAIFETENVIPEIKEGDQPGKLARRFYAPIGNRENGDYYFSGTSPYGDKQYRFNGRNDVRGQKIVYTTRERREGYFYGIDRVDFILNGYDKTIVQGTIEGSTGRTISNGVSGRRGSTLSKGGKNQEDEITKDPIFKYLSGLNQPKLSSSMSLPGQYGASVQTTDHYTTVSEIYTRMMPYYPTYLGADPSLIGERMKKVPGYGVLLFQIDKNGNDGDRVQYTGRTPISRLSGYSGIHKYEFDRVYDRAGQGGSTADGYDGGWIGKLCKDTQISKFFLDLDLFLGLYFVPRICCYQGASGYQDPRFYYDNFKIANYLENGMGSYEAQKLATTTRIKNVYGGGYIDPPFTDLKYPRHANNKRIKCQKVLLQSSLDLKKDLNENKDFTIEEGDFFISSLEYEGRPGSNQIGDIDPDRYTGFINDYIINALNLTEDFTDLPFPIDIKHRYESFNHLSCGNDDEALCVCSNLKGEIEIRRIIKGEYDHELSEHENQAVESVDGAKSKKIDYGLLKKIGITKKGIEIFKDREEKAEIEFLGYYYKSLGYKVVLKALGLDQGQNLTLPYWHGLNDEDIKNPTGHLFDLVNTDGYVFLREGKAHFIYKHTQAPEDVIEGTNVEEHGIDREGIPDELANASLVAKLNQVNFIYFKHNCTPIKSKFLFYKEDHPDETNIIVSYKGINTGDKITSKENYILNVKGDGDLYESIIELAKEPTGIQGVPNSLQLEELRIRQNLEEERYQFSKQRLGLNQRLADITSERAEGDLSYETAKRSLALATTVSGFAGSLALRGLRGLNSGASSGFKKIEQDFANTYGNYDANDSLFEFIKPEIISTHKNYNAYTLAQKAHNVASPVISALGFGASLTPIGGAVSLASQALGFTHEKAQRAKRIQEDKKLRSETLALQGLEIDSSHFERLRELELRVNNLSHQYYKESANDATIYEEGKKQKLKYGDKQFETDLYLLTYIPHDEALTLLEFGKEQFGVHCDIPDKLVTLRNGMQPNVIQMRNLKEPGIEGIIEREAREGLKARLERKIKIVENETGSPQYSYFDYRLVPTTIVSSYECTQRIQELEQEIEELKNDLTFLDKANFSNLKKLLESLGKHKDDKKALEEDLAGLRKLKEKIEASNAKAEQGDLNARQYSQEVIKLLDDVINLNEEIIEEHDKRKGLEDSLQKTSQELKTAKNTLQNNAITIQDLRQQANNHLDQARAGENKAKEHESKLSQCETEKNRLTEDLNSCRQSNKELEKNNKAIEAAKNAVAKELEDARNQEQKLQSSLKQKDTAIETYKKILAERNVPGQTSAIEPRAGGMCTLLKGGRTYKGSRKELTHKLLEHKDDLKKILNPNEIEKYGIALRYYIELYKGMKAVIDDNATLLIDVNNNDGLRQQLLDNDNIMGHALYNAIAGIFLHAVDERKFGNEPIVDTIKTSLSMEYLGKVPEQTNRTSIFDLNYPESLRYFDIGHNFPIEVTSRIIKLFDVRFGNLERDGNKIYNTGVYYDFNKIPGKEMFVTGRYITTTSTKFYENILNNKVPFFLTPADGDIGHRENESISDLIINGGKREKGDAEDQNYITNEKFYSSFGILFVIRNYLGYITGVTQKDGSNIKAMVKKGKPGNANYFKGLLGDCRDNSEAGKRKVNGWGGNSPEDGLENYYKRICPEDYAKELEEEEEGMALESESEAALRRKKQQEENNDE